MQMITLFDMAKGWKSDTTTLLTGAAMALPVSALMALAASAFLEVQGGPLVAGTAALQISLGLAIAGRIGTGRKNRG
jgi:hypothetical protein